MRYESSAAYEKASATVRWMARSSEPPGAGVICEAKLGTGINASDRSPWPCYGDATNGNCKSQIRVNDH
jgi:hypothetical protein